MPSASGQILAILLGGILGERLLQLQHLPAIQPQSHKVNRATGAILLSLFVVLLFGLPALAAFSDSKSISAISIFYQAGSLVFGGGHVVLPLLQTSLIPSNWISNDTFRRASR
jgi:chromate transporter